VRNTPQLRRLRWEELRQPRSVFGPRREDAVGNEPCPRGRVDPIPARARIASQRFDKRDVEKNIARRPTIITGGDPNVVFALDDQPLTSWRIARPGTLALVRADPGF
jgi:hypothetical protein